MAEYAVGVNDPEAVKLWSQVIMLEALKKTYVGRFIGKSEDSLLYRKDDLSKSAGDRIRCYLALQLTGAGKSGDETLEGNEENMQTFTDDVLIDQIRNAVRDKGRITRQRVPWPIRETAKNLLSDWIAAIMDEGFFNQLGGFTVQTDTNRTGLNAVTAPSSGRHLWTNSSATDDSGITSTDTFSAEFIDYAVETAETATPMIKPIRIEGSDHYVMFLHPYQVTDLRTDVGKGGWQDVQQTALAAKNDTNHPIFSGALGMWNNTVLHKAQRVPNGAVSTTEYTNVKRAILCGAQAGCIAYGQGDVAGTSAIYEEKTFDYGNKIGISAGKVIGIKKSIYNSTDFGTVVVSSYGAAHT